MFLPPEDRAIPPRREPPRPRKRPGDPATLLILLIAAMGLLAPVGGGTVVAMVWALRKLWG
ncbi:hypothetical protein Q8W71_06785 [Methylobacterium sp. NEAU 140]|uniref:hypothetical protein n=1 Tax=Methylobacterium sp. NEAU 140 TaxID=3064945 RepID=UPI0027366F01|nr:hypothetical protein [Methylobacterium sp. NEAU 140]MDP4022322.1 hypothetical protein [Methylobacterium sp. NEAU 140]